MKTFYFTVRGDHITKKEDYTFIEGNKGSYEAVFDFGKEWEDMAKLCVVENGDDVYKIAIIGNSCLLPEVCGSSARIGVIGVDALDAELVTRISTNMSGIGVRDGAASKEVTASFDSAASVWEKYLSDMENSRKAAEEAMTEAENSAVAAEKSKKTAQASEGNALRAKDDAENYANSALASANAANAFALDASESKESASKSEESAASWCDEAKKAALEANTAKDAAASSAQNSADAEGRIAEIEVDAEERLAELKKSVELTLDEVKNLETNAKASEEAAERSKTEAAYSATEAQSHADKSYKSSVNAAESEESSEASAQAASQALSDLLAMINSGDIVLATDGKLPLSSIPATATQEIYTVTSEDELTSLTAQRGDLAELIEELNGEQTITKTWQCLGDASVRENWVVWGTSYAVQSGNATTSDNAVNANMINNHRIVEMSEEEFASAVKDEDTYYLVY